MKSLWLFLLWPVVVCGQTARLLWGPVLGHAAHREVLFNFGFSEELAAEELKELKVAVEPPVNSMTWRRIPTADKSLLKVAVENLQPATAYTFTFVFKDKKLAGPVTVKTAPVYANWMTGDPPDFTFLAGSCFYLNDPPYDRPGKPYGQDPAIIGTMAATQADFNLLLGDNFYFREADWDSPSGMRYRYRHTFTYPEMARLLAARPNYAIWDDHDFGPNDADRTYPLRGEALSLFLDYWPNPINQRENGGIYTSFEYGDAAFFLLDDRWFRAPNNLREVDKPFLGEAQLRWLVESLAASEKPWKFLVCGNQVINTAGTKECYRSYSGEFRRLFRMLREQKVEGLIVLSGDRHFSELLCDTTLLDYPVYELTCSAVTSTVHVLKEKEKDNPLRVPGSLVQQNNFSRLSLRGPRADRKLIMEHLDAAGQVLWRHELSLNSLKAKKP